ncbi:DUF1849 family protein [Thalassospiraceae bacterium LMO-JJ14]|nr:DUF1849 family protein [Thalassospiraceae bacterium LMO-JJ14]
MAANNVPLYLSKGYPGAALLLSAALAFFVCPGDGMATTVLQASKMAFTPHRALYQMELGSTSQGSDVVDARGTMYYRFEPQCDGWDVESRVALSLHYGMIGAAPEVVETAWTFSSFESYDGMDFTYAVDHKRNGLIEEVFAGEAGKDSAGGGASFSDEEFTAVDLPPGTLFPAEHLIRLLKHARLGDGPFRQVVFDGANTDNPYEVNAIVIGPVTDGQVAVANNRQTAKKPHNPLLVGASSALPGAAGTNTSKNIWRVRMAYFPFHGHSDIPEFELEVDYREDGIAERMIQDFGDFTLTLTPSRIEVLPRAECN